MGLFDTLMSSIANVIVSAPKAVAKTVAKSATIPLVVGQKVMGLFDTLMSSIANVIVSAPKAVAKTVAKSATIPLVVGQKVMENALDEKPSDTAHDVIDEILA